MPKLAPADVAEEIHDILSSAHPGKGTCATFLTCQQIIDRLSLEKKCRLVEERGRGGAGCGAKFSAATLVAKAIQHLDDVETQYLDTRGLYFLDGKAYREFGYRVCAIYRITPT